MFACKHTVLALEMCAQCNYEKQTNYNGVEKPLLEQRLCLLCDIFGAILLALAGQGLMAGKTETYYICTYILKGHVQY